MSLVPLSCASASQATQASRAVTSPRKAIYWTVTTPVRVLDVLECGKTCDVPSSAGFAIIGGMSLVPLSCARAPQATQASQAVTSPRKAIYWTVTTPVRVLDVLECGKTCDVLLTKVQVLVR